MNIRLKKIGSYRRVALFVGVFVALVVSAGLANHALAQGSESAQDAEGRIISIYDRGTERVIVTKAHTLRQALESAHVDVAIGHDVVEPGLDTELVAAKYNVNIYRARPVTVVDGPLRQKVTTAEQTSEGIAKAAGITLYKEDNVTIDAAHDLLRDGAGVVMAIDRATPVTLTLYGAKTEVRTQMGTVGELLQEKGIVVGKEDTLSVPTSTPIVAGMSIELWRDGKQTATVDEEVDFSVEKIQDANREVGYREVQATGVKGKRSVTYEIEMKNGQEVGRTEIASVVVEEPKTQVEVVGAKAPTPANPTEAQALGKQMMLDAGYAESEWSCLYNLWMRESGWRTTAGNASSGAYGIPQSLPASKMAAYGSDYLTNPRTQISWGLSYIKGRYGTPCGAWSSFQAQGWY